MHNTDTLKTWRLCCGRLVSILKTFDCQCLIIILLLPVILLLILTFYNYTVCFFDFLDGDPHTNHFYIGFWVICGVFGFLTLEKVFSDENEGDNSNKKKENEEKVFIIIIIN